MTDEGLIELSVGDPAAGGGCVARGPDGRVVFVRHALPGERVRARITGESARFSRADAVEVLEASPDRVASPCPAAGPGGCGGCDYQHVAIEAQRRWKARLIETQLARLAGLERTVTVEALPEAPSGLGWRTRVRYAADARGRLGLRHHRSHELQRLDGCLLATTEVAATEVTSRRWPGASEVEVFAPRTDPPGPGGLTALVVVEATRPLSATPVPRLGPGVGVVIRGRARRAPAEVVTAAAGHRYRVSAGAFWQVHLGAPDALVHAVLELASPRPGEQVADLYAGVGLLTVPLGAAVGPTGRVLALERHRASSADLATSTAAMPWVEARHAGVRPATLDAAGPLDLVVLDPPREGAGTELMSALATRERLRAVCYVACDPAAFARDLRVVLDAGWSLARLRALDCFPMTEHVELVALLEPPGALHAPGG
jgi:tRNA/tmRNA/rRNA uracil-C5-methylase (TrmA/RlmC/RlmD family)